jgi:HD-like signal output (HDOD) protein
MHREGLEQTQGKWWIMLHSEDILKSVKNLPSLPTAVTQLSTLINNPNATVNDFERVIQPDPGLTTNLLRLANSAYFGFPRKITSVRQAVTLIGTKKLFEVAMSGAFTQVIPDRLPGYEIDSHDFWMHSIATAILSERLSIKLNLRVQDFVFTAGLLHDIGKLILSQVWHQASKEPTDSAEWAVHGEDAEKARFGFDHAEVGGMITKFWHLPEGIELAVRYHHEPSSVNQPAYQAMVDLVHTGTYIADLLGFATQMEAELRPLDAEVMQRLGINTDWFSMLAGETLDVIHDMGHLFA